MNHFTTLVIGFFTGLGVCYGGTQAIIELQARRVAALTEANYLKQSECAQIVGELTRKTTAPRAPGVRGK